MASQRVHSGNGSEAASLYRLVLPTKLQPNRPHPDAVLRQDLLDQLQDTSVRRTVIIQAPAGYGKSTLAAQWLASTNLPAAWLSLDPSDNDPIRFLAGFVAAMRSVESEFGKSVLRHIAHTGPVPDQGLIGALVEELALVSRPFACVLDDLHVLVDPDVLDAVTILLRNVPPLMRMMLLSRTEPDIPLARLRSRGELLELGLSDLRFSETEAERFFDQESEAALTHAQIALINERIEGWPAGLRLTLQAVKHQSKGRTEELIGHLAASVRPMEGYLWEEVLSELPPEVLEFLMHSAIFERFSAELYDHVFVESKGAVRIRDLEADGLFLIPLDARGRWYRYHHLFRDILLRRLSASTESHELASWHRRAAGWFAKNELVEEALLHAIAAKDWSHAFSLVEPLAARLHEWDQIASLRGLLEQLPDDIRSQHAGLSYLYAWSLARTGKVKESLTPLRAAERLWKDQGDLDGLGRVALLEAFYCAVRSDFTEGIASANIALERLHDSRAAERTMAWLIKAAILLYAGKPLAAEESLRASGASTGLARTTPQARLEALLMGAVLMEKGRLPEAAILLRHATGSDQQTNLLQVQHGLAYLGRVHLEQNKLEDAEQCFSRALRLSHESGTVLWRGRFSLGLALVHRARGDNEAALDEIDEAITLLSELGSPHETAISRAWQARIWLDDQRYPLAQRWAEHANLLPLNDPAAAERHIEYATFMRLIFTEGGKEADVLPRIERFRRLAVADERIGHAIEYDILAAIALQSAGRSSEAVARLDQAMTMASPGGYVRIFADEGERLAPLLQRIAAQGRHREFALRLLQTIGVNQESDQPDGPAPPNPLSDRELDVLRLAATGLSNRAIGDRLFITDKTAKKHISNILSKLEASNRTEAVDRARRLGLLHD